jgi:hypothetical protein
VASPKVTCLNDNVAPADVYFGRAEAIIAETPTHQARHNRRPSLSASIAGRLNSNPDEPDPPFAKRLISLKLSDDGQAKVPDCVLIELCGRGHGRDVKFSSCGSICAQLGYTKACGEAGDTPSVRVRYETRVHRCTACGDVAGSCPELQKLGIGLKKQDILDLGTGTGALALPFAKQGAHVTGVDISKGQMRRRRLSLPRRS